MKVYVFDACALIALLKKESGWEQVTTTLGNRHYPESWNYHATRYGQRFLARSWTYKS